MRIVVLAGGLSTERDVSLSTGALVRDSLEKLGHQAALLDAYLGYDGEPGRFFEEAETVQAAGIIGDDAPDLEKVRAARESAQDQPLCYFGKNVIEICRMAEIVFVALHGDSGENGKIQAAFDLLGIRYTGSGFMGSALAMNKDLSKQLFRACGILTPSGRLARRGGPIPETGYPCIVKPCSGGSSVGVSIAADRQELENALRLAFSYEDEVLVEQYIKGREFSVGVLGGKSLPVIEIKPKEGFYDYQNKYQPGRTEEICPAPIDPGLSLAMQEAAVKVFHALRLEVYGRVDFMVDEIGGIYCLEANTLPGMTPTSLMPQEAKVLGMSHGDLCWQIIEESLLRYEGKQGSGGDPVYRREDIKGGDGRMKPMTLEAVAESCGGTYFGPEEKKSAIPTDVTTDSRDIREGSVFIALKGERRDGHEFVPGAYRDGAVCCIVEQPPENPAGPYILVKSCYGALKDIAAYYRSLFDIPIVGITGSVGKTTTKEMIASVLAQKYRVHKTKGNLNNEIGVPRTLLAMRDTHQAAVVEMGISQFGEMRELSRMVRPDVCVITNIGESHLEFLGSREGVLKAKTEIFEYQKPGGSAILCGDDDLLRDYHPPEGTAVTYGMDPGNRIHARKVIPLGIEGTSCEICFPNGETVSVVIPAMGVHMVRNALAAAAVGLAFGMDPESIRQGIEGFTPVGGRFRLLETGKLTIIDDCYNANPTSMKASIDTLRGLEGRKICILGDMKELGEQSPDMHREVGRYAAECGIDVILCVGGLARFFLEGAASVSSGSALHYYRDVESLVQELPSFIRAGDMVLVKASRSMALETVVDALQSLELA